MQEQVAFGSNIIQASDNPTDAYKVLSLHTQIDSIASYTKNLESTTTNIYNGSQTLTTIGGWLGDIKVRLVQVASDTYAYEEGEANAGLMNVVFDEYIIDDYVDSDHVC